jgi:fermentation-respiration switch protein FrsA (DUF1100 family)
MASIRRYSADSVFRHRIFNSRIVLLFSASDATLSGPEDLREEDACGQRSRVRGFANLSDRWRVSARVVDPGCDALSQGDSRIPRQLRTHFDNLTKIRSVTAPLLIVSGTADTLTPQWMTEKIFAQARQPKQLYFVPGAGHNDLLQSGGVAL